MIWLDQPPQTLRLIELSKAVIEYLTSVLDPKQLPPYVVIDLYDRRWKIEEAFLVVWGTASYPPGILNPDL